MPANTCRRRAICGWRHQFYQAYDDPAILHSQLIHVRRTGAGAGSRSETPTHLHREQRGTSNSTPAFLFARFPAPLLPTWLDFRIHRCPRRIRNPSWEIIKFVVAIRRASRLPVSEAQDGLTIITYEVLVSFLAVVLRIYSSEKQTNLGLCVQTDDAAIVAAYQPSETAIAVCWHEPDGQLYLLAAGINDSVSEFYQLSILSPDYASQVVPSGMRYECTPRPSCYPIICWDDPNLYVVRFTVTLSCVVD
ncbi:hypothetical protein B0H13DRAFT_1875363 [Mycena leptocephala]|nr:hypothetical protein B0H13DRAFT_1875363 [Mycena leptocephala]